MVSGCKKASGSALPFKERLKIAVLLAQGMSLSAVANKVGCTVPTVRKWAKRSAQGSLDVLPRSGRPKKWGAKKKVASSSASKGSDGDKSAQYRDKLVCPKPQSGTSSENTV